MICHSLTLTRSLGFQHFRRDLANVNEWKIMFDPSIATYQELQSCLLTMVLGITINYRHSKNESHKSVHSEICFDTDFVSSFLIRYHLDTAHDIRLSV